MKTTLAEGRTSTSPASATGSGSSRSRPRAAARWGHNGVVPGYFTFIFSSDDGERQALLMVNLAAQSFSAEAATRFFGLIDKAFCS